MAIVRLQSNNVKRLRAVAVKPDGSLVQVAGNNGQGKTSLLDSIVYALGGKGYHPPEVLRRGAKQAEVMVQLDNGMVIERTWDADGGTSLVVKDAEGVKVKAPQSVLDRILGELTFDPLDFARLGRTADGRKQQADLLRRLVGLDFTKLDEERVETYAKRTAAHRVLNDLDAQVRGYPAIPDGTPDAETSTAELMARQKAVLQEKAANDAKRAAVRAAQQAEVHAKAALERANQRVLELTRDLGLAKQAEERAEQDWMMAGAKAIALGDEVAELRDPDVAAVEASIADVDKLNAAVRQKLKRAELVGKAKAAAKEHAALEQRIKDIDSEKRQLIANAKMPVPGLGFDADGFVTLNDLPLEQAAESERIRLSVAIGFAMNPELRVLLVRDGSLLDKNGLALLEQLASDQGGQVWLEVVGPREGAAIIIEDGTARGPAVDAALKEMGAQETGAEVSP